MTVEFLSQEIAYFEESRSELLKKYEGQFALIKGRELLGTFTTFEEAYDAGVAKLGNVSFLVKPIIKDEPVQKLPALTHQLIDARF